MKKSFFVMCFVCSVFLAGCATTMPETNDDYLLNSIFQNQDAESEDEIIDRVNVKIAKAISGLSCTSPNSFEQSEISYLRSRIFKEKSSKDEWLKEINRLVQRFSDGNVYVMKGKDPEFGLYEGNRLYFKAYSFSRKREYVVFEKHLFLDCHDLTSRQEILDERLGS